MMWFGRRSCLAGLVSLAVFLAACAQAPSPASSASAGPVRIVVGYSNISGDFLATWVAKEAHIFEQNGLDVDLQLVSGGSRTMAALLSGQLQISVQGGSEALSAASVGADLVVVGTLAPLYPYKFMVPASIKTPADLKGQKVGVSSFGGSADVATRVSLRKVGLDPDKDVTIVQVESHQNRTAALLNGSIQGGVDDPPATTTLEAAGLHALFDLAALQLPAAQTVITAQRPWANANRDVMQRFVDSIVQAIARMKKDKPYSVGVLKNKKYFNSDDDRAMSAAYDFFSGEVTPSLPYPKAEQFVDAQSILGKTNEKVRNYKVANLLDASFVQKAADRGLDKK